MKSLIITILGVLIAHLLFATIVMYGAYKYLPDVANQSSDATREFVRQEINESIDVATSDITTWVGSTIFGQ